MSQSKEKNGKDVTNNTNEKKKITIKSAIYELFDKKGLDVKLETCIKIARNIKKDTKFQMSHLSYWKSKYRKMKNDTNNK